jgi:hypothetical protein
MRLHGLGVGQACQAGGRLLGGATGFGYRRRYRVRLPASLPGSATGAATCGRCAQTDRALSVEQTGMQQPGPQQERRHEHVAGTEEERGRAEARRTAASIAPPARRGRAGRPPARGCRDTGSAALAGASVAHVSAGRGVHARAHRGAKAEKSVKR